MLSMFWSHRLRERYRRWRKWCPVCGARTLFDSNNTLIDGGLFRFKYCGKCSAKFDFVNMMPKREPTPEETLAEKGVTIF